MAKCNNCGAEGTRIRSRWREGLQLPDECPSCAPQSFEKFSNPSDQKIWMGYEAHPNEYIRTQNGYDRKPEYRAEQEERLSQPTEDERSAQERVAAKKRATRRTDAMKPEELFAALAKARDISEAMKNQL